MVTLFSLLNGDSMLDVFVQLHSPDFKGFIADLYLCTFICLFIYCAVNVFISIIADSYQRMQRQGAQPPRDHYEAATGRWRAAAAAAAAATAGGTFDLALPLARMRPRT